ncbi:MAG: putative glutamine amidotransferase [Candidatus Binatota bacterium]|jgi:putative glutamine amidotransferase|nr:putative glutamine amidotransferase [Candidatus Binatota bacterium]
MRPLRRRPLIGISAYDLAGRPEAYYLPKGYVEAVRAAGAQTLILPPGEPDVDVFLDLADGVLLSGGGDVHPDRYGGAAHDTIYSVSPERDEFESAIVRRALERGDRPLLCICRGMQVLNVALGGDLHPHLPDVFGERVAHRDPERMPTTHGLSLEPQSRIGTMLGVSETSVRSRHHQGIRRVAGDLRAVAWAPDGVIEAVEHTSHPFCIGVQWHPELQIDDPVEQRLFAAFVAACHA